jgi:steroid delta-isomerase-like uncharacterized protein
MSDENKALARRWFEEVWNKGRTDAVDEMMASDGRAYGLGDQPMGPAEFKVFHAAYRQAFPDMRIHIDEVIAEGDTVAMRWTVGATHRGELMGLAATGRPSRFEGMSFLRVRDGKIVEGRNVFDQLGMLKQLGVTSIA